jgi:hypothetical protein
LLFQYFYFFKNFVLLNLKLRVGRVSVRQSISASVAPAVCTASGHRVGVLIVFPLSRPAACCCLLVEGKALLISDDTLNVAIHYIEPNRTHDVALTPQPHVQLTLTVLTHTTLPGKDVLASSHFLRIPRNFPERIHELNLRIFQDFLFFTIRHGHVSRVQTPTR